MTIKRIFALTLSLILMIGAFSACGNKNNIGSSVSSDSSSSTIASSSDSSGSSSNSSSSASVSSTTSSSSSSSSKKFVLTGAKQITKFNNSKDVIICWGDSLTESMAMEDAYRYPAQLQGDIGSQFKVINAGVSGETSNEISSRANLVDIELTNSITFPKGVKSVELTREFVSVKGGEVLQYKGFGRDLALDDLIINGEKYKMSFRNGEIWDEGIYTLTRTDASQTLILPKGATVKYDYTDTFESVYCNVILMGANDKRVPITELIERYRRLGSSSKKNIYIIPYYYKDDGDGSITKQFKDAFGDQALDLRDYFVNHAHEDYDVEKTELDKYCIKKNQVPVTFCYQNKRDECHLSSIGYKVMADQVYKKGVELGYWK